MTPPLAPPPPLPPPLPSPPLPPGATAGGIKDRIVINVDVSSSLAGRKLTNGIWLCMLG